MADKKAAKAFAEEWKEKGDEKQDTQTFWIGLLQRVFGVGRDNISNVVTFEVRTSKRKRGKDFKDAVIYRYADNEILVEQKSRGIALDKKIKQSDGELLTPFEQAKRYDNQSVSSDKARWIITCNFEEFWIYDMEREGAALYEPVKLPLSDLPKHLDWLSMLESKEPEKAPDFEEETAVSVKAGELVGKIYDAFEKQYTHDDKGNLSDEQKQSLNKLCVRLVFCLYAEDSGLFRDKQFHDYMASYQTIRMRRALIDLFETLNTPYKKRSDYLEPELQAFPYVNGGLFEGVIEIPNFTDEIRTTLLDEESTKFDWSAISPTIFGAVFESTLNQETRRKGGMHYTSVKNIHRLIDPLFLDDLKTECDKLLSNESTTDKQLRAFQDKLAGLTFLDPASGSGNFLTESYICLRRLENRIIERLNRGQAQLGNIINPIKVSIQQFYGIEINDFAVAVAQTALWIAEHKMFKETEKILNMNVDFLPLKTFTHIHEGNALRMDWNDVIPAIQLNYIMGNPPFVGTKMMTKAQKEDVSLVFKDWKNSGLLDYVCCWYIKASKYIQKTNISCAFVSTNSIAQGEQVEALWKPLFSKYNIEIHFAYQEFQWDSEARIKAHVHVIIVGFGSFKSDKKLIYSDAKKKYVQNINGYLNDGPSIFITRRTTPLSSVPKMYLGCSFYDGNHLVLTEEEKQELERIEPAAKVLIRPYMMGGDFIDRKYRYCLWLIHADPRIIKKCPHVLQRIEETKEFRLTCKKAMTKKAAEFPTIPPILNYYSDDHDTDYLAIPRISSEKRKYIPAAMVSHNVIAGDSIFLVPDISVYHFGVISSSTHMAWMRILCGRLETRYRYSSNIVYNNFPWPSPTDQQKEKIEKTAQAILDARNLYPDSSLADLYDPLTMPAELHKAHESNDKAVMDAYGFDHDMTEPEIVAELMKMYQKLTEKENSSR